MRTYKRIFKNFFTVLLLVILMGGNYNVNISLAKTEKIIENGDYGVKKTNERTSMSVQNKKLENTGSSHADNEVIVKFYNQEGGKKSFRGTKKKSLISKNNVVTFVITDGKSVEEKIVELQTDNDVVFAQPNFKYHTSSVNPSDDSDYGKQWSLHNTGQSLNLELEIGGGATMNSVYKGDAGADIDVENAWEISDGSENDVIVAVLDTGVAYNHPDLLSNMWDGADCVDENGDDISGGCPHHGWDYDYDLKEKTDGDNDPSPGHYAEGFFGKTYYFDSHGTHVAGIIAGADNTSGIVGVAPHAQIMAVKIADLYTDEIVKGIAFAQNNGAKVINASWGGEEEDLILKDAIDNFDGLFITAAGNDASENNETSYPCESDLENIICIAATDNKDQLAEFSNYGVDSVDIAAPGENIISSVGEKNYAYDDFEDGLISSGLTQSSGAHWQIKDVTDKPKDSFGNFGADWSNVLYADNLAPYSDNANDTITSETFDFSDAKNADFYLDTACNTQFDNEIWHDYMALDFSKDNGMTWHEYSKWDAAAMGAEDKSSAYGIAGLAFSSIDKSYFTTQFKYRLRWVTDGSDNNYDGCFVDALWSTVYTMGRPGFLEYYSGTSMATPEVAGLAALVWGYRDDLSPQSVKYAILKSGDDIDDLSDKVITGKRINAQKTLEYLSSSNDITSFNFDDPEAVGSISQDDDRIYIQVPADTDVSDLTPIIDHNGASIEPASGSAQNFTQPVTYTVTASDASEHVYTVTVGKQNVSDKEITSFELQDPSVMGVIDNGNYTIELSVPYGTNVTRLIPQIFISGASVNPASQSEQNFTDPVTYTVTAFDGSTQDYIVTVLIKENVLSTIDISSSDSKPNKTEAKITFDKVDGAIAYMVSKNKDFDGEQWKPMENSVKVKLKKKSGKQKFYIKFKDSDGTESKVYTKTFEYKSKKIKIKNSSKNVKYGDVLIQSGKHFSKNGDVLLYFSKSGGGYYAPQLVRTDKEGNFSVSYKVTKGRGTYTWYAVDKKTNKKTKTISYEVK